MKHHNLLCITFFILFACLFGLSIQDDEKPPSLSVTAITKDTVYLRIYQTNATSAEVTINLTPAPDNGPVTETVNLADDIKIDGLLCGKFYQLSALVDGKSTNTVGVRTLGRPKRISPNDVLKSTSGAIYINVDAFGAENFVPASTYTETYKANLGNSSASESKQVASKQTSEAYCPYFRFGVEYLEQKSQEFVQLFASDYMEPYSSFLLPKFLSDQQIKYRTTLTSNNKETVVYNSTLTADKASSPGDKTNWLLWTGIAIVVIVVLAGGAFLYFKKKQQNW